MKLFSLFKSANRAENRRNRLALRAKRPNLLGTTDFYEGLEKRQLMATFAFTGSTVNLDLNVANQMMTVAANATSYTFTLSGGATNTWTGTAGSGLTASGAVLTANAAAVSNFTLFNITDSANNTGVTFGNSSNNTYRGGFNLTLNNNSNAVLFNGTSTFAGSNNLTILTDSRVEMFSASCLTMTNGSLSMDINTQATPRVLSYSGLMVNNATIQTNGTGQTTIVARGGVGPCATLLNKGVAVISGGKIMGGTTGTLSITGYGYNNQSISSNSYIQGQGVIVWSDSAQSGTSTISSLGANVVVTGYGANDTTANLALITACAITNAGVVVGGPAVTNSTTWGGLITSGGNGTVTVTGYGGSLADQPVVDANYSINYAGAMGVLVTGGNAMITSGGAGLVDVTGFGGGATANTVWGVGVTAYYGNIKSGANGSVVVNGTGHLTSSSHQQHGVLLYGDSCITTGPGSGTTTVVGQGGGTGNGSTNIGVYLMAGNSTIAGNCTITAGGSGNVSVTGTGGGSSAANNTGIYMNGTANGSPTITSNGGAVHVTGYGGSGFNGSGTSALASYAHGIKLSWNCKITAGGTGDVAVTGYGGNNNGTWGNYNDGVYLTTLNNAMPSWITSSGGNVTVLGVGGGGNENSTAARPMGKNSGVYIACGSYVSAGGMGNVTVTGLGGGRSPNATGPMNFGVYVGDGNHTSQYQANAMAYSCISSSGGMVTVQGTGGNGISGSSGSGGSNYGVIVELGATITSGGNADVNITGTGGGLGSITNGGYNMGVYVFSNNMPPGSMGNGYRATLTTGGSGNLTVHGTGGGCGTGSNNYGIYVYSGGLVTAGGATSSVTLVGQGGNTTGGQNYGVAVSSFLNNYNSTITSNGGNVSVTGYAPLASNGILQHGIEMDNDATITSGGNGSVTVTGYGGTGDVGTTGTGHVGVSLASGSLITSGGTGPVLVNGYGGGSDARVGNYGVYLSGVSVITPLKGSTISGGANAPVTVNGYGGNANGTGATNAGVYLNGNRTFITSSNGTVHITGIGGQTGTTVTGSSNNYGVFIEAGATASSTGTAPITVNGTGGGLGNGNASTNPGVLISTLGTANSTPKITSNGGLVTVMGTGGGLNGYGTENYGVDITSGGLITTTGNGTNITVIGTGGGTYAAGINHGIYMAGNATASNYTVTANGGNILLIGTEGDSSSSYGVAACSTLASVIGNTSTPGNVTIETNILSLATSNGSAVHGSVNVTIQPRTAGKNISLGDNNDLHYGPLMVSDAELATLSAPTIQFGNATSGSYIIAGPVDVPVASNLTLLSNTTGTSINPSTGNVGITMGAGKVLNMASVAALNTTINGKTAQTDYNQLNVVGDLNIAGKTLNLSGSYTTVGGDVFTIVNATNLTGTFAGLANGSTTTFNGHILTVNYNATSVTLNNPAPVVVTSPANTTVNTGQTVTFSSTGTGNPSPTVQWQVRAPGGSWANITNATSTTYSLTASSSTDGNQYQAVFTNIYGSTPSAAATLTVQYSVIVTSDPTNQSAPVGGTATFTAAAQGNPAPTVKWQSSPNGTTWTDIAGATSTSYTTGTLAISDSGKKYRAVFNNAFGDVPTNAATLTVGSAPSISTQPTNQTATAGNTATFTAAATGTPTPTVKWQSSPNGTTWTDIPLATSASYTTGTLVAGDNGKQYRAIFTNGIGTDATTNAVTLTVNSAPAISTQPTNQSANDGQTATFNAAATGNPTPTVQWQVNTGSGWANVTDGSGGTTNSYTTPAATSGMNGYQYRAVYTNGIGSDATSNAVTLTVNSSTSAPSITTQPTNQTATAGNTATFTAAATGSPTPTVKWQSSTNGTTWTDIPLATSNSYTTGTLVAGDNGKQYRAIFTNGIGTDATTNAVTLTVNYAPAISTQPTNQSANDGQTATFTAAATGNPTPTVQWQVNTGSGWANVTDGSGGTTNSYTTPAATSGMNGYQYRAVYTNGIGSDATSSAVTLTVNSATSAPVITSQPVKTGVEAGQTATFSAAATGNPTPTVQWQSSPNGSTGWADISGATSATLSFTASAGDNGKYYRAVFTNGISPDATTNAAKLLVGIAPVITTVNEMTIPVGLTSGMTVIATGSPAPTYSIVSGSLPAGVTLDSTTGLFMGTPAVGTVGSWPVTIKADNGIGNGATQAFALKVTSTITSFTVSKGLVQRSYVRYLDLGMDSNASALALLNNPSRVQLTKADLNGVGSTPVPLTGFLSVPTGQSTLAIDFGTIGMGNSRNTTTADGYYTLGVDLDGNGTFETNLFFFRLFGETNGDREVTAAEQSAVLAGCTLAYNANLDTNGDGVVNTSDYQYVKKSVGRKLKSTLIVTA